ncbi:hypothetical protein DQ384_05120 [Sphaerisporangium album]|uniref:Uncharacterized protein n=1 Tax=Sphaerisporangium album TaxID=509200 RepID=A0A367FQD9_9ACTN|nr:hypothetical protein [Sphaerisporangium album]RCG31927.1 hypothetical protein DQ384_05120 [Sphaerisporangium album]
MADQPYTNPKPLPATAAAMRQVEEILTKAGYDPADIYYRVDHDPLLLRMPTRMPRDEAHQHLTRYAAALIAAGLGVATCGRGEHTERLIVAGDQATADQHAPHIQADLRPLVAPLAAPQRENKGPEGAQHG